MLTAVLSTGSSQQRSWFQIIYTKVYGYYQPYEEYPNYRLAEVGQAQMFLTYFTIIVINQSLMDLIRNSTLDALLIVINLSVMLLGLYYECKGYLQENSTSIGKKMRKVFIAPIMMMIKEMVKM